MSNLEVPLNLINMDMQFLTHTKTCHLKPIQDILLLLWSEK